MAVKLPKALTIAGLDSGGGAGITADLKTFHAMGVYGMVALTAVTAQNTLGVKAVQEIEPSIVEAQINAVAEDIGVDAAKTGMLSSSPIMESVAKVVRRWGFPLVVDPVMYAKSGDPLMRQDAIDTLRRTIIPLAKVVTPNIPEAEALSGVSIRNLNDAKAAAKRIAEEFHPEIVIVKGGHLTGAESIDVVYFRDNGEYRELSAPRISTGNTHGTGCSFSAAIAAGLAKGMSPWDSIKQAKELITMAIQYSLPLGHGHGPVNPMSWIELRAYRYDAVMDLSNAMSIIKNKVGELIDSQDNGGIAVTPPQPYAIDPSNVITVTWRSIEEGLPISIITRSGGGRLVKYALGMVNSNPELRALLLISGLSNLISRVKRVLSTYEYGLSRDEARLISSALTEALRSLNRVPDAIHLTSFNDLVIMGESATAVVNKLMKALS
ncbi:bifunctional hydroxymethylpyrimidine kinase/phosphomethylpyrimidine kinase [Caldivirga maquilingensis]|uniref:Phosphomethylpyrimidine kinase n=1 Tax=Caldivirga maquilingensis (strain ATCC 700844 / DSM 13496 / JCM 10307 / IC-167) TaxID=397948 RepID=A8MBV4_CALMQ|nr:bifunctional hydroxymethylpyrimidine kinase/phosphomethylpyrimidine kinase [Caldivirga maquilingensis]ABW01297.1 phosphomethylpyrimidine kinase [Caldivirga maquilingensis IC-167]